jgi:hypothetical protein
VDQFKLSEHMEVVASRPAHLKGLNVQTFDAEAQAIAWLHA